MCRCQLYQELLAIANLLNIKIFIFTYGIGGDAKRWSWKTIHPNPIMAPKSEFATGTVHHMYLYNSDSTHYDLLVEDNSRLAVLGLISMEEDKVFQENKPEETVLKEKTTEIEEGKDMEEKHGEGQRTEYQWTTVQNFRKNTIPLNSVRNHEVSQDGEELNLLKHKQNGHKRDGPQSVSKIQNEKNTEVNLEADMEKKISRRLFDHFGFKESHEE